MAGIRTKIIYVALPILLYVTAALIISSADRPEHEELKGVNMHMTMVSLDPPDDLSFSGEIVPLHDFEVRERLDNQLIRNIYYHSSTIMNIKRANRWRPVFMPILEKNGIPEDFFYLAVAESALSNVTSPAGAKGFWQFMPATGKSYGLEITDEVDERLDPEKSTRAACQYLNDAHRMFGNWTLTAASYNMGMGGLRGQLNRQKVDNYYDLYLNAETGAYVFRILALKSILENPADYGFNLKDRQLYQPLRYRTVKVDTTIPDLIEFALKNGTTYKMLKVLNPWILKDKLTVPKAKPGESQKVYYISIPLDAEVPGGQDLIDDLPVIDDDATEVLDSVGLDMTGDSVKPKTKEKPKP